MTCFDFAILIKTQRKIGKEQNKNRKCVISNYSKLKFKLKIFIWKDTGVIKDAFGK